MRAEKELLRMWTDYHFNFLYKFLLKKTTRNTKGLLYKSIINISMKLIYKMSINETIKSIRAENALQRSGIDEATMFVLEIVTLENHKQYYRSWEGLT